MNKHDIRGINSFAKITIYGILLFTALVIVFPLLYVVITSFASAKDFYTRGFFLIPEQWDFQAYRYLTNNIQFVNSFRNSILITVVGTFINMAVTSLMAYGLSKKWLKGRSTLNFLVFFTMLFGGGMIPTYLVVDALHLIDSFWALWLPTAAGAFYIIIMRSFYSAIPFELEEAARIDGCGEWRLFFVIILPLSKAALATFSLFYMVGNWNTFFHAILYFNGDSKWPLQVFLKQMMVENEPEFGTMLDDAVKYTPAARMAAILLTALPMMLIYPFLQKHFNKGMLLGSVKG